MNISVHSYLELEPNISFDFFRFYAILVFNALSFQINFYSIQ